MVSAGRAVFALGLLTKIVPCACVSLSAVLDQSVDSASPSSGASSTAKQGTVRVSRTDVDVVREEKERGKGDGVQGRQSAFLALSAGQRSTTIAALSAGQQGERWAPVLPPPKDGSNATFLRKLMDVRAHRSRSAECTSDGGGAWESGARASKPTRNNARRQRQRSSRRNKQKDPRDETETGSVADSSTALSCSGSSADAEKPKRKEVKLRLSSVVEVGTVEIAKELHSENFLGENDCGAVSSSETKQAVEQKSVEEEWKKCYAEMGGSLSSGATSLLRSLDAFEDDFARRRACDTGFDTTAICAAIGMKNTKPATALVSNLHETPDNAEAADREEMKVAHSREQHALACRTALDFTTCCAGGQKLAFLTRRHQSTTQLPPLGSDRASSLSDPDPEPSTGASLPPYSFPSEIFAIRRAGEEDNVFPVSKNESTTPWLPRSERDELTGNDYHFHQSHLMYYDMLTDIY